MTDFPELYESCRWLNQSLLPIGLVIVAFAIVFRFFRIPPTPVTVVEFLLVVAINLYALSHFNDWVTDFKNAVDEYAASVPGSPDNLDSTYQTELKKTLEALKLTNQPPKLGYAQKLAIAIVSLLVEALFAFASSLSTFVLFIIDTVQKMALLVLWAVSSVFIPALLIAITRSKALLLVSGTFGIASWKFGMAISGILNQTILKLIAENTALAYTPGSNPVITVLMASLLGIILVVWLITSSLITPVITQWFFMWSTGGLGKLIADKGLKGTVAAARAAGGSVVQKTSSWVKGASQKVSDWRANRKSSPAPKNPPQAPPAPTNPTPPITLKNRPVTQLEREINDRKKSKPKDPKK